MLLDRSTVVNRLRQKEITVNRAVIVPAPNNKWMLELIGRSKITLALARSDEPKVYHSLDAAFSDAQVIGVSNIRIQPYLDSGSSRAGVAA